MNFENAYQELKEIREKGSRDSERVIELWNACISDLSYKLGDEVWIIYEQVFIAALDTAETNIAQRCYEALQTKFSKESSRVKRLCAMFLEYQERFDEAREVYQSLLKDDPSNSVTRKRLIALLKSQGKTVEAIKELNKYLESFQSDYEAWGQLCDLYLNECDYKKAAFCMEELILSNPHNHLFHQMYAEIKYTEGGLENIEISRSYFAEACRLNSKNLRALLGLRLTSLNLYHSNRTNKELKKECLNSIDFTDKMIKSIHESVTNCMSMSTRNSDLDINEEDFSSMLKITAGDNNIDD